ncbi:MAG: Bug family tripartite tricarboxylate transporter substrate binding protein [Elioraea tepidiphila]
MLARRHLFAGLALAPTPLMAQPAGRALTLVVPFAPGGSTDVGARLIAPRLAHHLGQSVVVENRPGAGGATAADQVRRATPDGSTLLIAVASTHGVNPAVFPDLPYDAERDFAAVALLGVTGFVLVVRADAGFADMNGLVAKLRAEPGKHNYASAGVGSMPHLAGEWFRTALGLQVEHVPYRGGAPAIVDIVAGRTDMMFGNMPEFLGQIRGGGLRPIAFGAPRASPLFPGLPLIKETVPGFEIRNWFGVAGPGGMPPDLVARWNAALRQVAAQKSFQDRMAESGMEIIVGSPEEFRATIAADRARWAEVIQKAGIRAD